MHYISSNLPLPDYEHIHQVTWDELSLLVELATGDVNYLFNPVEAVAKYLNGELIIMGARYFIAFPTDEDYILFKLKFL